MAKKHNVPPLDGRRRQEVFLAADEIRAERTELVSLRSVRARMKRNGGVAGNNQCVGGYLSEWSVERQYSPVIEMAGLPQAVSTRLAKASAELWQAAQAEAAAVMVSERWRMDEVIQGERELRNEAMALLDAREVVIEAQRSEIAWYAVELERMREHVQKVRAREFWNRVVEEIWDILPNEDAMHVRDITLRIGADLVQEAEGHRQVWNVEAVRGTIDQLIYVGRMFASDGGGRYRRRRPEDDAA